MKIQLHIGTEKTGTTTIQHFCRDQRDSLLEKHILYPEALGKTNHTKLIAALQNVNRVKSIRQRQGIHKKSNVRVLYHQLIERLTKEIEQKSPQKMVISNEHLSSRLASSKELLSLKKFLANFSEDIEVYVYLRRQDEFLLSRYSTSVKNGRTKPFSIPKVNQERLDFYYDHLLEMWSQVFGQNTIHVRVFQKDLLVNRDIVSDFCDFLDIPLTAKSRVSHNISLDWKLLEFLRELNGHLPPFIDGRVNPARANLVQVLSKIQKEMPKTTLIPVDRQDLREFFLRFQEGNNKIAQLYLNKEELFSYETVIREPINISEDSQVASFNLSLADTLKYCADIWKIKQVEIDKIKSQLKV
ncbi:MAG: hypothetical protein R2880_07635 [Deinococcales bacterium]